MSSRIIIVRSAVNLPAKQLLLVLPFTMLVSTWVGAESQDSARPLKFNDVYNGCCILIDLKSIFLGCYACGKYLRLARVRVSSSILVLLRELQPGTTGAFWVSLCIPRSAVYGTLGRCRGCVIARSPPSANAVKRGA